MVESNHQVFLDEAVGMIISVKSSDLLDRRFGACEDLEQAHFLLIDVSAADHVVAHELLPTRPVGSIGQIHQDDRYELTLTGLGQSDRFEKLVVGAEATGKNHNGIRLLDEDQFARKEKMKVHELWIVADNGVCQLRRRQANVDAETLFSSGAFVTRLHDTRPGAGNDHKPSVCQGFSDIAR